MTSNIGSNWIQEEKDETEIKKRVQEALRAHFRPEFLNRIDEMVIFKRLTDEQLGQNSRHSAGPGRATGWKTRKSACS